MSHSYVVAGLPIETFQPLFGLPEADLARKGVLRRVANATPGYPCRVGLQDAERGESLLLLNFVSHDVQTPYRNAYAIYVSESAVRPAVYEDRLPPVLRGRPIALRLFNAEGLLIGAELSRDDGLDAAIRKAFDETPTAYIHAHNAAHGCFAARIDRS